MIAAAAMLMSMAACQETGPEGDGTGNGNEGEGGEAASYSIALSDPLDAEIILNAEDTETFKIGLKTDLTEDQLTVSETTGADWCSATITDNADSIRIIPGANPSEEDITAEFKVEGVGVEVTPLTFKVTRRGTNTEPVVEISAEGVVFGEWGSTYTIPAAQNTLTVTVTTNMARWYLTEMNMVYDENYNPIEWYTVDKTSGRSGETATIVFSENTGLENRMVQLTFDYEPESFMGKSIMVTQYAPSATYAKISIDGGKTYLETDSYNLNLPSDGFGFVLDTDGAIEFKFVKPGTDEIDNTADWIGCGIYYGGSDEEQIENEYAITADPNTTGADRAVDMIITPAGSDEVLFRFIITQAGA